MVQESFREPSMNDSHKLQILIADDEESFLRVLTTVLESTNRFEVFPCESGEEAVEAIKRARYDVLILDHKMPGMTGLNILQWLHEQKSELPVIMLTGAGSENIAVEAMKLGAYDYVSKEHFDRIHFPIVVSSVYERYLFKKEKALFTESEQAFERDLATLQLLRQSLSSITRIATTTLNVMKVLTLESEESLLPHLAPEGQEQLQTLQKKIRSEIGILESVNQSMVDLSIAMVDHYGGKQRVRDAKLRPDGKPSSTQEKTTLPR